MVKRVTFFLVAVSLCVWGAGAMAQAPSGPPQPGPEHARLAYFVGSWVAEADLKPSPYGPGGKYTGNDTCEWIAGHFGVLCHTEGSLPTGKVTSVSMLGYDAGGKTYLYTEINNYGEANVSHGTVEGDTWTWMGESKMEGKLMRGRFTMKVISPDVATYKFEMAPPDSAFTLVMEGKQTRKK